MVNLPSPRGILAKSVAGAEEAKGEKRTGEKKVEPVWNFDLNGCHFISSFFLPLRHQDTKFLVFSIYLSWPQDLKRGNLSRNARASALLLPYLGLLPTSGGLDIEHLILDIGHSVLRSPSSVIRPQNPKVLLYIR